MRQLLAFLPVFPQKSHENPHPHYEQEEEERMKVSIPSNPILYGRDVCTQNYMPTFHGERL